MKREIISSFTCTLLILIIFTPVVGSINICKTNKVLQGVIDQSQEERDSDENINEYAWQEFIPFGENLWSVQVKIRKGFLWPDQLVLSIEKPLGNVLTSTSLTSQDIPWETADWVDFDFPDIPLEKEEKYYIVLSHESDGTYKWSGAWDDPYHLGDSSKDPQWDWCFRTIVDKSKTIKSFSTFKIHLLLNEFFLRFSFLFSFNHNQHNDYYDR